MRNLKSVGLVEQPFLQGELPPTATAWDASSDTIICAFGPVKANTTIDLRRKRHDVNFSGPVRPEAFEPVASWDAPCPRPDLECDRILSLQYFADNLSAVLVLEGGDIIVVREEPQPGEDKIEIVGSVDVGITAAAWSPDEELLVVTTSANTLLYMTKGFENVAEATFMPEDLKAARHVSVGWGKKETQFQGKRARALQDPTIPEKVDEGNLSGYDDGRTNISWRGDGAYVAVNSVEAGIRRVIRVYSRGGALDSVSEPVDGLEGALSWRPAGNLIAGVQRLEDRVDVVFFERNGLRHGQFTLRILEEDRNSWASWINLAWNIDSTVLAVCFQDRVQLWVMRNYHYYLKQEIPILFRSEIPSPFFFRWHHETPLRFVVASPYSILDADWVFDVCHGSTTKPTDVGAVAVIDGKVLKLTPLKLTGVPPPMAHCEVSLDSNIVDVSFSSSGSRIGVLTRDNFSVFLWSLKRPVTAPLLESSYPLPQAAECRPRQIAFLNDNEIYILNHYDPFCRQIERTTLETRSTKIAYQAAETEHLHSIFASLGHERLWLSLSDQPGKPISYATIVPDSSNGIYVANWNDGPPTDTSWAEAAVTGLNNDETVLVAMSKTGSLYVNKRLLTRNATSFILTPAYVIFTTSQHLLKFVHLTNSEDMEVPDDTPEADERCRCIERGGGLITVMPSVFAVVLQMPRGNLETIYPRALVLAGIRGFINARDYRSAFLTCRSQMVDMNILHDYDPDRFMANVPLFIDQVQKVEFVDEFLSRLREEDVCQTLYKETLPRPKVKSEVTDAHPANGVANFVNSNFGSEPKINRICNAFLATLKNRIETNLRNLVTAHVCKSPPDLDAGLQLVARLREQNPEDAEEAIEHMCFLTDAHRLYNNALGLYDLELTLLVAQQAQRDPREYLPFLRNLQQLPQVRRFFEIDNYLSRFSSALRHLHTLKADDELKLYAIKHSLYREAIDLYRHQPNPLREMTKLFADYLYDHSNYKEAAIAYESLSLYEPACKSYQLAHLWRESLTCALLAPFQEEELKTHAQDLATTLTEETRDYASAAQIYAEHLSDIATAARLLCRGLRFGDATRLLALHGKQALIPEIVDTGITEAMGSITEFLADCKSQLLAQVPRIRELRVLRVTDSLAFFGGDPSISEFDNNILDNVSLAPTDTTTIAGRSMFTRYTSGSGTSQQTSRNRRREERKRARGKKGTVYEAEYLVKSVGRLTERVNSAVDEVQALVEALLRRGMREHATSVERALQELLEMCRGSVSEVFETQKEVEKIGGYAGESQGKLKDIEARSRETQPQAAKTALREDIRLKDPPDGEVPLVREFKKLVLLS